jgi:DNA-binding HxlR family transcriptional regulator
MENSEFIRRTGAPEVLIEVAEGGKRFTDVKENVEVSSATLSNRLKEGKVEDLWEEQIEQDPDGSARRVYVVLPRGQKLAEKVQELGLPEVIEKRQEIDSRYKKLIDEAATVEMSTV